MHFLFSLFSSEHDWAMPYAIAHRALPCLMNYKCFFEKFVVVLC
jgi:hypothetical protein